MKEISQTLHQFYENSDSYLTILENANPQEQRTKAYIDIVCQSVQKGQHILELGCGIGVASFLISQKGVHVAALDLCERFLRKARFEKSSHVQYLVGDITHLSFTNQSFDVVALKDVIEHVCDVPKALTETLRVTKEGGKIILVGPNLLSPLHALKKANRHFYGTSKDMLVAFFRNCGLLLAKHTSSTVSFLYRTPKLTDFSGPDDDAVYLSYYLDIVKWFRKRDCQVSLPVFPNAEKLKTKLRRIVANFYPCLDKGFCLIVTKKTSRLPSPLP